MRFCWLIAGILLAAPAVTAAAPRMAVLNFSNHTGSNGLSYLSTALPEAIVSNLARSRKIGVVERMQMKSVLNEIALQQTGLFEASQVTQVGKMVKADLLLLGSFTGTPENLTVVLKVVQVSTSQVVDGRILKTTLEKVFDQSSQSVLAMVPAVLGQDIGYLTVHTNPEGAEVYLDGSQIGVSPLVDYRVGAGQYRVEVFLKDHFPEEQQVTLRKDEHANWSPLLGQKRQASYSAFSFGLGYSIPGPSAIKSDLNYLGRLQHHWKSFHVGAELAYASYKHDQELANPFSATNLTVARRYRDWFVTADFAYYPFATAQVLSPYIAAVVGYVNIRDTQLEGSKYEVDNLKLDGAVLGGKIGFVVLPQADFHFFVEARYNQILPKYSRKIFSAPTISQGLTSTASEDINFTSFGVVLGFTICFDRK